MPPAKRKAPAAKKSAKKKGSSAVKRIKKGDKAWKSSYKVENGGTPGDSRSSTPASFDHLEPERKPKGRSTTLTSRDFIRQVLEFDKASDSDDDSVALSGDGEEDESLDSEAELKKAIKKSLKNSYGDDSKDSSRNVSDTEDDSSDDNVSTVDSMANDLEAESMVSDSNMSFPTGAMTTEQMMQSVYAPMPEFIPEDMPDLPLPESSDDLMLSKEYILRAVAVYEIFRMYRHIIRLSPFLFEDFAAALVSKDHNILLQEIYGCLIKTLLREEDNNQTSFGPPDLKDSINSSFYFNDAMTYIHVIKEYLGSDSDPEFCKALDAIIDTDYPLTTLDKKLTVLETMCNLFLTSNSVREDLSADGLIKYDDHCRVCQKMGDVLCCDGCPGVYHMECVDPPLDRLPAGEWYCSVCLDSEVRGVSDCISSTEKRSMNRQDPLGYDRHWRKYWFLVRRIIIEGDNDEVSYISTERQFEELMDKLDGDRWERQLVWSINQRKDEIISHFTVTQELTNERKQQRKAYIDIENERLEAIQKLKKEQKEKAEAESKAKEEDNEVKAAADEAEKKAVTAASSSNGIETKTEPEEVPVPEALEEEVINDEDVAVMDTSEPGLGLDESNDLIGFDNSDDEDYDRSKDSDSGESSDGYIGGQLDGAIDSEDENMVVSQPATSTGQSGDATNTIPNKSIVKQVIVMPSEQGDSSSNKLNLLKQNASTQKTMTVTAGGAIRLIAPSSSGGNVIPSVPGTILVSSANLTVGSTLASPIKTNNTANASTANSTTPSTGSGLTFLRQYGKKPNVSLPVTIVNNSSPTVGGAKQVTQPVTIISGAQANRGVSKIIAASNSQATVPQGQMLKIIQASPGVGKPQVISAPPNSNILKIINAKNLQNPSPGVTSVVNKIVSSPPSAPGIVTLVSNAAASSGSPIVTVSTTPRVSTATLGSQRFIVNNSGGDLTKNIQMLRNSQGKYVIQSTTPSAQNITAKPLILTSQTSGNTVKTPITLQTVRSTAATTSPAGTVMKVISSSGQQIIVPNTGTSIQNLPRTTLVTSLPASTSARAVTLTPQTAIRPKMVTPSAGTQTVILVDKDGTRSTIQIPQSAINIGKDGKSLITLPQQQYRGVRLDGVSNTTTTILSPKVQVKTPTPIVSTRLTTTPSTPLSAINRTYVTRTRTGTVVPKKFEDSIVDFSGGNNLLASIKAEQELLHGSPAQDKKSSKILMKNNDADSDDNQTDEIEVDEPYKLGMDGQYKHYVNQYSDNPLALSKAQVVEERDRKRHLSYKFSLTTASDFKWHGNTHGSTQVIMRTLRASIQNFEETLPMCFLHPHWSSHRPVWIKHLNNSDTVEKFAAALATFEANIKPVLFNAAWNDSLGHLSMMRQTMKDKEDLKKKEKVERRKQELEEQNIHLAKITTIKYSKGLKHQIHKLKGEEYRISDFTGNGWMWVRATRKEKHQPQDTVGLRQCARKLRQDYQALLKVKNFESKEKEGAAMDTSNKDTTEATAEASEKAGDETKSVTTSGEKQDVDNFKNIDKTKVVDLGKYREMRPDLINVSEGLKTRNLYPRVATPASKLNSYLQQRMLFEKFDQERRKRKQQQEAQKVAEAASKDDSDDAVPTNQNTACYSPMCRSGTGNSLLCYSSLCRQNYSKMDVDEDSGNTDDSKPTANDSQTDIDIENDDGVKPSFTSKKKQSEEKKTKPTFEITRNTNDPVSLLEIITIQRKVARAKAAQQKKILVIRPHKYTTRSGKPCPFVLSNHELKTLSRKGGKKEVLGYNYSCKNAPAGFWPYPAPRPRFRLAWEYRLFHNVTSLHGIASMLRVLWASIRWDDMATKAPAGGANTTTSETDITTREVLSRRDVEPFKLRSEYKVRTIVIPLNFMEQSSRVEINEPIREGLRKRKKHQVKQPAQPTQTIAWIAEEQLELWEISSFHERSAVEKIEKTDKQEKSKKTLLKANTSSASSEPIKIAPYLSTLKVPQNAKEAMTAKEEIEEQLKLQRAAAQAKRQSSTNTQPIQKMTTTQPALPAKIDGNTEILPGVTLTLATKLLNGVPMTPKPDQTFVFKGPGGQSHPLSSLSPDQMLLKLLDGKITVITKARLLAIKNKLREIKAYLESGKNTLPAPVVTVSSQGASTPVTTAASPSVGTAAAAAATVSSSSPAPTTESADSADGLKNLTSQGLQESLLQAQKLGKGQTESSTKTAATTATSKALESIKSEDAKSASSAPASTTASEDECDGTDDEGTTLSTDIMQAVVAQALSNTQAPDIQSRLQEMQKKLSTVQGTITVSSTPAKSTEDMYSEYKETNKESKPIRTNVFEPKKLTEEEIEQLRLKKLKNKEDYKRRKEKDRVKKLNIMLEKHKNLLRKEIVAKQTILKESQVDTVRDEIFAETGERVEYKRKPSTIPKLTPVPLRKAASSTSNMMRSASPSVTPTNQGRGQRASTSKYAKKRRISESMLSENGEAPPSAGKAQRKSITKPKSLQNKLYCVCRQPYDKNKFYVTCDICAKQYHGSCVGVPEGDEDTAESFTCKSCQKHQQETADELYCICRKPYNDSQFYVGCDECEDWFHPSCVGISQEEAEAQDTYICPRCTEAGQKVNSNLPVKGHVAAEVKKLVKDLQAHEMAWPFLHPVDRQKVPDYYEIITDPMDLHTLSNKLKTNSYSTITDFAKDVSKIFNNARYYNTKESPIFLCAESLEKFFVQRLKEIKQQNLAANS